MKPKDPTAPKHAHYHEHDPLPPGLLPEDTAVASANECTGLMFTPPENAAQQEAYQELSPMAIPRREPGAGPTPRAAPARANARKSANKPGKGLPRNQRRPLSFPDWANRENCAIL